MDMESGGGGSSNVKPNSKADDKSTLEITATAHHHQYFRRLLNITLLFTVVAVSCLSLYHSAYPFQFLPTSFYKPSSTSSAAAGNLSSPDKEELELKRVLKEAAMENKTVIITTLNEAWAAPNSIFDVFLESFRIGNQTLRLLNHLIIVALDQKAYARCLALHPHCYYLTTQGIDFSGEAYFMTGDYLKMMWRRIDFLQSVLKLGYDFVFTDADIMWFRDPFPRFYPDADFQIACDNFRGNPYDLNNRPNGGFNYVKSSNRTVNFYKFWYDSRETYPGLHDQDVLNKIKFDPMIKKIGMQIRFLDTAYFGGFCEPSKDFNVVCTMHANCCFGLESKVHDLRVMLQDWTNFMALPSDKRASQPSSSSWSVPQNCSLSNFHPPDSHKKNAQQGGKN